MPAGFLKGWAWFCNEANDLQLTIAIGDEIRDTTHMTDLESSFEGTRVRLRGNMKRMLRMAERTGVGWKVWLGFIFAVFLLFFYVWLF